MVSDTGFYITLGLLIFFALALFGVFYMLSKKFSPDMMKILTTLHAAIFGYETAMVDLIGPRGYKTHVFPEIIKVINTLKEDNENIMEVFDAKTPLEAMQRWLEVMVNARIIEDSATVTSEEDGKIKIDIKKCSMCHPIHEILGQKKGICPLALILSSASSIVDGEKEPTLEYSEFTPTGTVTILNLKDKE